MLLFAFGTKANNLTISNVSYLANDQIQFTVTWNNSWNINVGPANRDAAWIVFKYQDCTTPLSSPGVDTLRRWQHIALSAVTADHTSTGDFTHDVPADGMGILVYKSATGISPTVTGTVIVKLASAIAGLTANSINVQILGFEVVYVPQASFVFNVNGAANVTSTAQTANIASTDNINLALNYPSGFAPFYCMKYEITQHQYMTFLNSLDITQQAERVQNRTDIVGNYAFTGTFNGSVGNNTTTSSYRNGIRVQTVANYNTGTPAVFGMDMNGNNTYNEAGDGLHTAANYLSWDDLTAFLDWIALRPMTEMEYEKACRGTNTFIPNEYAWGGLGLISSMALDNLSASNESYPPAQTTIIENAYVINSTNNIGVSNLNSLLTNSNGPARVGFASNSNSTYRESSGGSYYGIMDMTGNVWEQCVGLYSNPNAAINFPYTGTYVPNPAYIPGFPGLNLSLHGNGMISSAGHADVTGWAGAPSTIIRGGSFYSPNTEGRVSDRSNRGIHTNSLGISTISNNYNYFEIGGRGVRSAP
jgi:formylglycine-generating enzyme required for sulfatase activity